MKLGHFEALAPLCPTCLMERSAEHAVQLAVTVVREGDDVLEGVLKCTERTCQAEYPIIDGIPLLLPKLAEFVKNQHDSMLRRDDLSPTLAGVFAELLGQQSTFERDRSFSSSYTWGHYGDLDPREPARDQAGTIVGILKGGLALAGDFAKGPWIDTGCSVGRTSFELAARGDDLVLGIDVNLPMLQVAARVLRKRTVRYPRRRVGLVYDVREFQVTMPGAERVDFWACDAQFLPFRARTFGGATSLNVIDCVSSPPSHLQSMGRVLRAGAPVVLATPYEWTDPATPQENWLGGKNPRGAAQGRSEIVVRALLDPSGEYSASLGLVFDGEIPEVPWLVRLHDRGILHYAVHVILARATGL